MGDDLPIDAFCDLVGVILGSNEKLNSTCTLKNGLYDDFEE